MSNEERKVSGTVNGEGVYFSRVAAAAGYAFFASTATDSDGNLAEDAIPPVAYRQSPSAQVRAQTSYIFDRVREDLEAVGSSIENVCQVEQYIQYKSHADGYLETSRGPGVFERNRPGSALLQTGDSLPPGTVVTPTGIGVLDDHSYEKEISSSGLPTPDLHPEMGASYKEEAPYSEIVTGGPYAFNTVWASDYETGVHPAAKVAQWVWWGNEARGETQFNLHERLGPRLQHVGSSFEDVVHATVYLTEIEDLYEVDRVWAEVFPTNPPARTVVPVRGLGSPRWEGAKNHADGGTKTEAIFQTLRHGFGAERVAISTGASQLTHESEAIKAAGLLWTSGQMAVDEAGRVSTQDATEQAEQVFDRITAICEAGGTDLSQLLRIRAYVTDANEVGNAVYKILKQRVPIDPPTVALTTVPNQFQIPDCRLVVDAVAYAP